MDMQQTIRQLEQAALDGHRAGQSWQAYFAAHTGAITAIIGSDSGEWGSLRDRLLALLVSGEISGQHPAGDSLDQDEARIPVVRPISDTKTAARLLWPEVTT
jgi:hypothetical protein